MAFPKGLLGSDEELILDLHPHWLALIRPVITTALIFVAMGVALAYVPSWSFAGWIKLGIVVLALALFFGKPVPRVVAWLTSQFVVTTGRVIHRSGLLSKRSMEIPLESITDVRFDQGVLERLVGAGSLILESPGEYGEERFSHVARPERVRRTIYELTEENRRKMAPVTPLTPVPPPSRAPSTSVADEIAKLARLRQQGILTEQEFQAQKARLLESS
jgi:uncharacterized membrane protein YdbT with pleckstrin-like domain